MVEFLSNRRYIPQSTGGTSGEIDFVEMCPVGSVATNFGAGGQPGEEQEKWKGASGVTAAQNLVRNRP